MQNQQNLMAASIKQNYLILFTVDHASLPSRLPQTIKKCWNENVMSSKEQSCWIIVSWINKRTRFPLETCASTNARQKYLSDVCDN